MDFVQVIIWAHQPEFGMQCLIWQKWKLEVIPDPGMYIFLEKATRRGVSYISNRYSKANNKYLKSYNPKKESKHVIYLGANNLYDYAMSKFRLASRFKWLYSKEFDLNKYTNYSSKGCVLEADLEYPEEKRELHKNVPLAPYKIEIKSEMLFNYQLKIADLYNILLAMLKI